MLPSTEPRWRAGGDAGGLGPCAAPRGSTFGLRPFGPALGLFGSRQTDDTGVAETL